MGKWWYRALGVKIDDFWIPLFLPHLEYRIFVNNHDHGFFFFSRALMLCCVLPSELLRASHQDSLTDRFAKYLPGLR